MATTEELQFYQGLDTSRCLRLTKTDCETGLVNPIPLAPLTDVWIFFDGQLYKHTENPGVFDWTIDPNNGRLDMKLGLLTTPQIIPVTRDRKTELVLVDPSNPNGLPMDDLMHVNILELS